ncbi:hypothetical protein EDEG_00520 [Edhazardia aedis USNM 41457]|uniref:Uncharacterized protein n=1 Tax=Edhazardia aedis (strain USNM 41457) TaxID=1003232 RepID=J9DF92_EDHAE|nr:hypothetical protein EDEG_00520 [Edhazardia aedis USNM 41457]|eukprot:EJW01275.1 hypothetical protein EDEG_00520 [Edhazardia aedis USNM 41457]
MLFVNLTKFLAISLINALLLISKFSSSIMFFKKTSIFFGISSGLTVSNSVTFFVYSQMFSCSIAPTHSFKSKGKFSDVLFSITLKKFVTVCFFTFAIFWFFFDGFNSV